MTDVSSHQNQPTSQKKPDPCSFVIFGVTGDLTHRLVIPSLYNLAAAGLLPDKFCVVGIARKGTSNDALRDSLIKGLRQFATRPVDDAIAQRLLECVTSIEADPKDPASFDAMRERLEKLEANRSTGGNRLFYLATPPDAFAPISRELGRTGLLREENGAWRRLVIEKPFGTDLVSAQALNGALLKIVDEHQIYRIDHYLGKETVQNILVLRFANGMFEPIWNRNHIDHVQIDIPETLSIEMRGSFYEETGAFRDMIVTHLFQVLGFVAMEPPTSLEPKALGLEREKVFESMPPLRPENVVRGRYEGYRQEEGVDPASDTETFVAIKAFVDNWRWEGVPFYLRSGKRLQETKHLLTVAFTEPPRRMFPLNCAEIERSFGRDHLTFELGDPASISASFLAKLPGPTMQLGEAHMRFDYADSFGGSEQALDAYERLIHDVMVGDRTLFTSSDAIERLWQISEPVLRDPPPSVPYEPGSWGPSEAHDLIAPRRWHLPSDHV